jgi:O-antigen ligase
LSYLALIVCIIFILWLLWIDQKQNPTASPALWIPTIWMMLHASLPLGYWLGAGEESNADRVVLAMLLCLGFFILVKRRFDWYSAFKENIWLTLLILFMCLSVLWSDTPLGKSFKDWVRELLAVIMGFLIASEADPREGLQSVMRRFIYILIPLSLLIVIFFPEQNLVRPDGEVTWGGVAGGKNGLGRICFISVFFLFWSLARRRQSRDVIAISCQNFVEVVIIAMSLFLMKGPGTVTAISITSILILVVGLGMFSGLLWMKKFNRNIGAKALRSMILAGIVLGTASVFIGGLILGGSVATAFGRDETLTGRSEIWARYIPHVMKEPIVGHGISGTEAAQEFFILGPHNGYLAVLVDYGFAGLLLFSMFLLFSGRKAHKELSYDYYWGSFWICFLVMALFYNILNGGPCFSFSDSCESIPLCYC